jgi:hypothetical protein
MNRVNPTGDFPTSARLAALALPLILLAACEPKGAPAVAAGPQQQEYFPLVDGARWVYAMNANGGRIEVIVDARGTQNVNGIEGDLFIMDESTDGDKFGMADTAPVGYVRDDGYVSRYTALDYDTGGGLRSIGGEDPMWVLPLEPSPGVSWTQDTGLFELPEGGGASIRWTGKIEPIMELDVPAGHFADVLKIRKEYWDESVSPDSPLLAYEDFYARGVGLIRSVTYNEQDEGSEILTQELVRYEFPAASAAADAHTLAKEGQDEPQDPNSR